MFNAYFQIAAIGFICFIVLLLLMIKRKCFSVYKIFMLALIFVLAGGMLVFAIRSPREKETENEAPEESARLLDDYVAYLYARNGLYDDALRILAGKGNADVTDENYLVRARLTALGGDYDNAALLYSKYLTYKKNRGEEAGAGLEDGGQERGDGGGDEKAVRERHRCQPE